VLAGQSLKGGEAPLAREKTEQVMDKAGARPEMQVHDTLKEGSETVMLGEGEESVGSDMTNTSPPSQEAEEKLSPEEKSQEVSLNLEEVTEMSDERDDQSEEEETLEEKLSSEEEGPEVPLSSEEGMEMSDGNDNQPEGEGTLLDSSPLPSLAEEEQERRRRRGRTRQRTRGVGRVRETKTLLASRTYCSHAKMQRDIKSLLHLGPSGRDEELSFSTFDECTDPTGCGAQGGHADAAARCEGCSVRSTVSGFSPCSTGTRLRRFKSLWLRLRGDRTGTRAVLGDRVLQHPWAGLLKVQAFREAWQQGTATKFMGQLREEGFPDLALAGEELLQAEPRGILTWTTGIRGRSHWGLQSPFWSSMGIGDRTDGLLDAGWMVGAARDPHRVWLSRLEEWEWWLDIAARMTRRIDIAQPSIVTWNIGPMHWLFSREWIRRMAETSAPLLMFQEVRLPPGSHRTVKWCLSQMCPAYDIWMEEGREAKGPLKDRRDHGFDCGLGLAVITMTHRRVFDASKTKKIEWLQGSQQRTLGHMTRGRILMLGLVSHSGDAFRCINMHQAGYSDTTRRELIVGNLTRIILENKSM
jgi:hypothetical protein